MGDNRLVVLRRVCPKCGHHKMFDSRGTQSPFYRSKCCKCNYMRN